MTHRQLKPWYFVLEGLNSFATALYFNYLFFFMQSQFEFDDRHNLSLSALNGLLYTATAWYGGRHGQRRGYFSALRIGFSLMLVALAVGFFLGTAWAHVAIMLVWTFGICFTWPTLEALVCDHEPPGRLPRMIGIYNLVWAGAAALAYFLGGAILESLGPRSIFVVPGLLHLAQLGLLSWIEPHARRAQESPVPSNPELFAHAGSPTPGRAQLFLRLAWLANPFAYMAISTIIPVIPGLSQRHGLSPMWAGFFCSIWFFARMGAFLLLWLWPGWHYRFRWFAGAFALLVGSFLAILLAPNLALVLAAQLVFGCCCGLLYYASLFYSMDAGDTKAEHGGIHESAIGAGIFAGPAVGAAALWLLPHHAAAGTWTVGATLLLGFLVFLAMAWRGPRPARRTPHGS